MAPVLRSMLESMVIISPVVAETRSISRGPLIPAEDHDNIIVEHSVILPIGVLIWILSSDSCVLGAYHCAVAEEVEVLTV